MDIFRIFDALNDADQIIPAIEAVRRTGTAVAEAALCYTGNLSDPDEDLYTLDYYLGLAEQLVDASAHILAIKDMVGLLRPAAAKTLVTALRERFEVPVHLHTHDTAAGSWLRCWLPQRPESTPWTWRWPPWPRPRPSRLPPRWSPLWSTPSATRGSAWKRPPRWSPTGRPCVRSTRRSSRGSQPHRPGLPARDPGRAAVQPAPAGHRLGPGERFESIEDMYHAADTMLGRLVKVTPSSKVVGDLALQLVGMDADPEEFEADPQSFDLPDSVIQFLAGQLGDPPGAGPSRSAPRRWRAARSSLWIRSSAKRTRRRWPQRTPRSGAAP